MRPRAVGPPRPPGGQARYSPLSRARSLDEPAFDPFHSAARARPLRSTAAEETRSRRRVPPTPGPRGRAPWARRGALLACGWFVALGRRSRVSVCSLSASNRARGVRDTAACGAR